MAKKTTKKKIPEKVEQPEEQGKKSEKKPKIFPNVYNNLLTTIILLGLIVLLMSGIIYYQGEWIEVKKQVYEEKYKNKNFDDFSYYRYSIPEFERLAQRNITSVDDVTGYLVEREFETIELTPYGVYGKVKTDNCYYDRLRDEQRCQSLILDYNHLDGFVEIVSVRE